MALIQSDSQNLTEELNKLLSCLKEAGAYVHPDLIISSADGDLSVKFKLPQTQEKLITLPESTLLPIDMLDINLRKGVFDFKEKESGSLTAHQQGLSEAVFSIYNLTQKANQFSDTLFWLLLKPYPDLLAKILSFRSESEVFSTSLALLDKGIDGQQFDDFVLDAFMKTRVLGYKSKRPAETVPSSKLEKASGAHSVQSRPSQVLMPVVDYFNHHWKGSSFNFSKVENGSELSVKLRKPVEGSDECFAFYGPMDALDCFIKYSFMDLRSPVLRSVPVNLLLQDGSEIKVAGAMASLISKKLGKQASGLKRYFPKVTNIDEGKALSVSHLFIPDKQAPYSLRRILAILIRKLTMSKLTDLDVRDWVGVAEAEIIEKNTIFYQSLLVLTENEVNSKGESEVLSNITKLAQYQLSKINEYQVIADSIDRDELASS